MYKELLVKTEELDITDNSIIFIKEVNREVCKKTITWSNIKEVIIYV